MVGRGFGWPRRFCSHHSGRVSKHVVAEPSRTCRGEGSRISGSHRSGIERDSTHHLTGEWKLTEDKLDLDDTRQLIQNGKWICRAVVVKYVVVVVVVVVVVQEEKKKKDQGKKGV